MLRALLLSDPLDTEARILWNHLVDFERLDYASLRLVPLLFLKSVPGDPWDRHRSRMKGIYRYFLYRNSLLESEAFRAVAALREQDIEVMLIKGLAVALTTCTSLAQRPMADVDLLVRRSDFERADFELKRLGWNPKIRADGLDLPHSRDYTNGKNQGMDLHWRSLLEAQNDTDDDACWMRSRLVSWKGTQVRIPAAEDQLIFALVNGLRDLHSMKYEWVVDVHRLLEANPPFNWKVLFREVEKRKLEFLVVSAWSILDDLGFPIKVRLPLRWVIQGRAILCSAVRQTLTGFIRNRFTRQQVLPRLGTLPTAVQNPLPDSGPESGPDVFSKPFGLLKVLCDSRGWMVSVSANENLCHWIPRLCHIQNPRAWGKLKSGMRRNRGQGMLAVPSGVMRLTRSAAGIVPRAQIRCWQEASGSEGGGESTFTLRYEIRNTGSTWWLVSDVDPCPITLHWSFVDESGGNRIPCLSQQSMLIPHFPGMAAFLLPGQCMASQVVLKAPAGKGVYRIRIDIQFGQDHFFPLKQPKTAIGYRVF
jgi:hypothetical protein